MESPRQVHGQWIHGKVGGGRHQLRTIRHSKIKLIKVRAGLLWRRHAMYMARTTLTSTMLILQCAINLVVHRIRLHNAGAIPGVFQSSEIE